MKFLVLFLFMFCVIITLAFPAEETCTEGDTKKADCNTCHCAKNGLWACTRKFCIQNIREAPKICEPGKSFQQECNTCVCNHDGTNAACTLRACL